MERSVAQKARIEPGTTIAVLNAVPGVVKSLGLPEDVRFVDPAGAGLILLFVSDRVELEERMPPAVAALGPDAVIWVLFRKGSKPAGFDMSRNSVWEVAEGLGLRPLGLISVDATWSAFRLRHGPGTGMGADGS